MTWTQLVLSIGIATADNAETTIPTDHDRSNFRQTSHHLNLSLSHSLSIILLLYFLSPHSPPLRNLSLSPFSPSFYLSLSFPQSLPFLSLSPTSLSLTFSLYHSLTLPLFLSIKLSLYLSLLSLPILPLYLSSFSLSLTHTHTLLLPNSCSFTLSYPLSPSLNILRTLR